MAFDFKNAFGVLRGKAGPSSTDKSVGIDVGSSSIKVVEVKQTERALTLSTYGELQLAAYVEQELGRTVKLEPEQSIQALVDIMREAGVTAGQGVFAVPLVSSFLTTVALKAADEDEVERMIPVEARKYIPIPLKEVALDWYEVAQTVDDETVEVTHNVLLAAIQNQSLAHFQRLLSAVNLQSQPTEIETFSAIRAVIKDFDAPAVVIDLGAGMSKLYIMHGPLLQKIHRVKSGGEQITKNLAQLRSISFAEAERIKTEEGSNEQYAKDVKTAMTGVLERPFQEFKRVLQQYQNQQQVKFENVVLIGGGAQLDQIQEYVEEQFSLPAVVANPFSKVAYPAFMEDTLAQLGSSFAVALGAAMRPYLEE